MERNRQAEFFFNGLVGHVRSYDGGTSTAGTRPLDLPITGVVTTTSPKYMMKIPRGPHFSKITTMLRTPLIYIYIYGEQLESEMEDDTSLTVETGHMSIPSQVKQLASLPLLHNMLLSDRECNAPILEKLEIPPPNPNTNPTQLFMASDLAHLASHLSITAQTLSQHAQNQELDDISDISD